MRNKRMEEKIQNGEAVDLSKCRREGRYYIVPEFIDGVDYCDAVTESWIWSMGRRHSDGVVLASTGTELYQNAEFRCLFLR
jgi:hypothetical protein